MGAISNLFGYLLNALYSVFNNYGIAIIVFSVILRIILIPVTIKQQKSLKKSAELQEEMKEIQRKYKNNPEKLNQETIELYKREKLSPFAGCFSSIIQIIIILSVFWLVSQPLTYMKKIDVNVINEYKKALEQEQNQSTYKEIEIINKFGLQDERVNLNMDFIGLDLSKVPSSNLNDWTVYIIPMLYVISSVISIKVTNNLNSKNNKKNNKNKAITDGKNNEIQNEPSELEAMEAMNKNMMYMLPLMSVFIAFIAPLGLALYWFVSNLLMIIEKLFMQVGTGLLEIADPEQDGMLLPKIAALRQRVTDELGYIIPNIRIMDSSAIGANEYMISVRGNTVAVGTVYPKKSMVIADQWDALGKEVPKDAIIGVDPTYQTQAYWMDTNFLKEQKDVTAVDSVDVIITHLQDCVRKYVDEIMTKTDVLKLMELVKSQDPTLVNDLVPTIISTSDLRKIFVNLIREKVSIKDIIYIFERLCDYARFSKEPDILSERLRAALGRQICLANCTKDKILYALTLSPEWEKTLDDSCQRTELGTMFLLNPLQVQELIESAASTLIRAHQSINVQPVILCSPRIRLPLYQLLERHIPTIVVISYSELITDIRVEAVDTIGESVNYNFG